MSASPNIRLDAPCPSHSGDELGDDSPTTTTIDADKSGASSSCRKTRALQKRVHQYISKHPDRFHSSFPFLHATHTIFVSNAASRDEAGTESQDGVRIFITHTFSETEGHSWVISSPKENLASLRIDPRLLKAPPSSGIDLQVHKKLVTFALMRSLRHGRAVAIAFPQPQNIHSVAQGNSDKDTWQCAWCLRWFGPVIRPPHLGIQKCFECWNG